MRKSRKGIACLLASILTLSLTAPAFGAEAGIREICAETGAYLVEATPQPAIGSIGGEWAVLGLARSGYQVPEGYFDRYYAAVEQAVKDADGVLSRRKYTEYARVSLALTAIGKDPRNVAGYDLLQPLGDFEATLQQGLNGPIWALIALDAGGYDMPKNEAAGVQATRTMYLEEILRRQLPDGGFSLVGNTEYAEPEDQIGDPDITAMALIALSRYTLRPDVQEAVDQAVIYLSEAQDQNGGFQSEGESNVESCAQVLAALCELHIAYDDPRFVKDGRTVLDGLLQYYKEGAGFGHSPTGGSSDQMSTEQAYYALVSLQRVTAGQNSLYQMDDVDGVTLSFGLLGRYPDLHLNQIRFPGKTFPDIGGHEDQAAIEALTARGVVEGKSGGVFDPQGDLTRAEFSALTTRALGLEPRTLGLFSDVAGDKWYAPYVDVMRLHGIVYGVGSGKFAPDQTISRGEAATMVQRAAKLCGLDTARTEADIRRILSPFQDQGDCPDWAREAVAFCYDAGLLDPDTDMLLPNEPILRCEMAQILYRMMDQAALL